MPKCYRREVYLRREKTVIVDTVMYHLRSRNQMSHCIFWVLQENNSVALQLYNNLLNMICVEIYFYFVCENC